MLNEEVFIKMLQIRQLQKEAICTMLPDSMIEHLDIIEEESKSMMKELLGEMTQKTFHTYGKVKQFQKEAKVRNEQAGEERNMEETEKTDNTTSSMEYKRTAEKDKESASGTEGKRTTEAKRTTMKATNKKKSKKVCNIVIE